MIPFAPTQEGDRELIELAFSKKKADDRKEWLRQFKVMSRALVERCAEKMHSRAPTLIID